MRAFLKKIIPPALLNQLVFRWQQLRFGPDNRLFKQTFPDIILPDDYTLYESYQLHYRKYIEDGRLTAAEILDEVNSHLPAAPTILDWGCGPARITRHLHSLSPNATVYSSDPNSMTINWVQRSFPSIYSTIQSHTPPLPFASNYFDLVIGFSVLTHLPIEQTKLWLKELNRILKPGGVLWISSHGQHFIKQLSKHEQAIIRKQGTYTSTYPQSGHRMMSSYYDANALQNLLKKEFDLLNFFDGNAHPHKAGGQDLWVVKKSLNL